MTDIGPEPPIETPRPPGRRPIIAIAAIVLGAAVLAWVFGGRFGQDPRLVDSPLIGQPFPDLTLDYLEQDGSLTFSDLKGKVLVVNFWASWCIPCRIEHPALTGTSGVYGDRGVEFIGIVYQDSKSQAIGFLDEFGRGGEHYRYVVDPDSRATVELGVFGVPETYFVDAEGIIRGKVQGEVNPVLLVRAIEDVLAGRTPEL